MRKFVDKSVKFGQTFGRVARNKMFFFFYKKGVIF